MEKPSLFERAEALGVDCVENDFLKLLEAVHEREDALMRLRHDIQRRIAGIVEKSDTFQPETVTATIVPGLDFRHNRIKDI